MLRRSHATYYFIAGGCHLSLQNYEKAQKYFDAVPELLEKKKIGGKDLPTEVWIKKKRECRLVGLQYPMLTSVVVAFYKEKQKRRTGAENDWVKSIKISPAEGTSGAAFLAYLLIPSIHLELGICEFDIKCLTGIGRY